MFKKETTDRKYHEDPLRAVNFSIGEDGIMRCLNGKDFHLQYRQYVKGTNTESRRKGINVRIIQNVPIQKGVKRLIRTVVSESIMSLPLCIRK